MQIRPPSRSSFSSIRPFSLTGSSATNRSKEVITAAGPALPPTVYEIPVLEPINYSLTEGTDIPPPPPSPVPLPIISEESSPTDGLAKPKIDEGVSGLNSPDLSEADADTTENAAHVGKEDGEVRGRKMHSNALPMSPGSGLPTGSARRAGSIRRFLSKRGLNSGYVAAENRSAGSVGPNGTHGHSASVVGGAAALDGYDEHGMRISRRDQPAEAAAAAGGSNWIARSSSRVGSGMRPDGANNGGSGGSKRGRWLIRHFSRSGSGSGSGKTAPIKEKEPGPPPPTLPELGLGMYGEDRVGGGASGSGNGSGGNDGDGSAARRDAEASGSLGGGEMFRDIR